MSQVLKFQQQAIKAARQQEWAQAVDFNQKLLKLKARDLKAMNRLGAAYLQLDESQKAKKVLEEILKLDNTNKLAQKNLERLKNKSSHLPNFNQEYFIEEPGRSKLIELVRLSQKEVLLTVDIGQECNLDPKSSFISVNADDDYLGALPQDVSERLTPLIKSGNSYDCRVTSSNPKKCVVFVKEKRQAEKNKGLTSFRP